MRPTKRHMKVERYVEPAEFDRWRRVAEDMGFLYVASGPLVRSSYKVSPSYLPSSLRINLLQAGEYFIENVLRKRVHNQQTERPVASDSIYTSAL